MSKARKISQDRDSSLNPFEGREGLAYTRVSSKKQETEGSGLESQEGRCVKDLLSINVPHVKTFPDSFSGGGDFMNRPAMKELLEYVDARPHKKFVVVFDDLSRFARDVFFHIKLRGEFKKRGVILRCLNYNFDESEEGEFAELIFAGKAELDRKQNRRQVIQKQKARLELGYWSFGAKKGYDMVRHPDHGKISIPNKEAKILKEVLESFSKGIFVRKIDACRFLVEKGFWKKQSPEKYIDKFTLIVRDPFHAGFVEYPVWEVSRRPGKHKAIISIETYELNQKRLGNLDSGKRIRTDISDDFPLRGLLTCADCGSHITGSWVKGRTKKHPYYWCQKKSCPSFWKANPKKTIESKFDKLLKKSNLKKDVAPLVQVMFDRAWEKKLSNLNKLKIDAESEKVTIEKKIEELTDLMLSTKSATLKKTYERQIESFGDKIESINSRIPAEKIDLNIPYRTTLEKATEMLRSPYKIWKVLDTREKQALFYFIFDEKLLYSKREGYRTAQIPSAIRLFEEFATANTHDVEMGRIELPCRRFLQINLHV